MTHHDDDVHSDHEIQMTPVGRRLLEQHRRTGAVSDKEVTAEDILILEVMDRLWPDTAGLIDRLCKELVRLCDGDFEDAISALRAGKVQLDPGPLS